MQRLGAVGDGGFQGVDDGERVVAVDGFDERGGVIPRFAGALGEQVGHLGVEAFDVGDQVDGVSPGVGLFAAAGADELGDERGQDAQGVFVADQVEQLEGFVHKVEHVADVGVGAVGGGGEEQLGDFVQRSVVVDGSE